MRRWTTPCCTKPPLPAFGAIRAEHVEPAIRQVLDAEPAPARRRCWIPAPSGWDGIVAPVERMQHRLARTWSPVGHLNGVANSDELRAAYNVCLPLLTAYHTEFAQNERLYAAYQRVADTEYERLRPDQRRLLDNALRDFRLAGVALDPERKQRFKALMERLASAQAKFDENVLDATNAWTRPVADEAELAGLPEAVKAARARRSAARRAATGWLFTLDAPNYQAVLTHAENRQLRRDFYTAWVTRASEQGEPRWDNTALMEEILALRHEAAQLVGFGNFAEYSLATKMANDPAEVLEFLRRLARLCRPGGRARVRGARGVRRSHRSTPGTSRSTPNASSASGSPCPRRSCGPISRCRACSTACSPSPQRLYGIRIAPRAGVEVYHPDVTYYDILDADGERRGGFFLDLYARPKKRGGAWMDECVGRIALGDGERAAGRLPRLQLHAAGARRGRRC